MKKQKRQIFKDFDFETFFEVSEGYFSIKEENYF